MNFALILMCIGCILCGSFGSYLSFKSFNGGSAWLVFISGQLSIAIWAWTTKQKLDLTLASLLFECFYNLAWFITLIALGEAWSWKLIAALACFFAGILLAAL